MDINHDTRGELALSVSGIIGCRRYLAVDSRPGSMGFYESGVLGGRVVHRYAGVCVKGRIALHKHCNLARVGRDRALSGGCFESRQNRGFGQMT